MPIYCFTTIYSGETIERLFPAGKAPPVVMDNGIHHVRDYQAEVAGQTAIVKGSSDKPKRTWPMRPCIASGVHADDAQELRDHLKKHGCPTEVTTDGNPIYTSAVHQGKALKCRGLHNKASF